MAQANISDAGILSMVEEFRLDWDLTEPPNRNGGRQMNREEIEALDSAFSDQDTEPKAVYLVDNPYRKIDPWEKIAMSFILGMLFVPAVVLFLSPLWVIASVYDETHKDEGGPWGPEVSIKVMVFIQGVAFVLAPILAYRRMYVEKEISKRMQVCIWGVIVFMTVIAGAAVYWKCYLMIAKIYHW
jgi:hypothetical protein